MRIVGQEDQPSVASCGLDVTGDRAIASPDEVLRDRHAACVGWIIFKRFQAGHDVFNQHQGPVPRRHGGCDEIAQCTRIADLGLVLFVGACRKPVRQSFPPVREKGGCRLAKLCHALALRPVFDQRQGCA